jgi:hypothetical protein
VIVAVALWAGGCGYDASTPGYCTDKSGALTPLDDGNPCTLDECSVSGTPLHEPVPDDINKACSRGPNSGTCKHGTCELDCLSACKCASDAECPMSDACTKWACINEQCTRIDVPDGTQVDTLEQRDCKKTICISGTPQTVADTLDIPEDVLDDCKIPACDGMNPSTANDDADKPPDTPGDCNTFICNNGTAIMAPNDNDIPASTECAAYSCAGGTVVASNANTGKPCTQGACNSAGQCADCLSATDWGTCGGVACPVKMCNGELCAADNTKCKSGFCADTVCCNEACSAACKSCNLAASTGACTNIPYYEQDQSGVMMCTIAVAGSVCDGNGKCLRTVGTPCNQNTQCISNTCMNLKCLGATGEKCTANAECVSNMCVMGTCS